MSEPAQPQAGTPEEDVETVGGEPSPDAEVTDMGDPEATGEAGGSLAEDAGAAEPEQKPAEAADEQDESPDVDPVEREIEAGGAVSEVSWPG